MMELIFRTLLFTILFTSDSISQETQQYLCECITRNVTCRTGRPYPVLVTATCVLDKTKGNDTETVLKVQYNTSQWRHICAEENMALQNCTVDQGIIASTLNETATCNCSQRGFEEETSRSTTCAITAQGLSDHLQQNVTFKLQAAVKRVANYQEIGLTCTVLMSTTDASSKIQVVVIVQADNNDSNKLNSSKIVANVTVDQKPSYFSTTTHPVVDSTLGRDNFLYNFPTFVVVALAIGTVVLFIFLCAILQQATLKVPNRMVDSDFLSTQRETTAGEETLLTRLKSEPTIDKCETHADEAV